MVWWSTIFIKANITWWRHQMETFSALLALCAGNSPVPVKSPHKGQWRGALMLSLICAWMNDWVNNREAGDLRHHRGHYDVNVMKTCFSRWKCRIWEYDNQVTYGFMLKNLSNICQIGVSTSVCATYSSPLRQYHTDSSTYSIVI